MIRLAQYGFLAGLVLLLFLVAYNNPLIFFSALGIVILMLAAKIKTGLWP